MATQFAGGTYLNYTYVSDGNINSFISTMQTQLSSCGWSVVSSTTGNILMKTATTPMGLNDCFRFKNNSGTSMSVSLQNASGTLIGSSTTTSGGYITPIAGYSYKILGTQYWFLIVQLGNFGTKSMVYGGVLYIPSFMTSVYECGFMISNYYNDTGGSSSNIWRNTFSFSQNNVFNYQITTNSAILDIGNNGLNNGNAWQCAPTILQTSNFGGFGFTQNDGFTMVQTWGNGDILTNDPLMCWAIDGIYTQILIRGQLYDATTIAAQFPGDTTYSFGGHNWFNVTHNCWYMSLFFATS